MIKETIYLFWSFSFPALTDALAGLPYRTGRFARSFALQDHSKESSIEAPFKAYAETLIQIYARPFSYFLVVYMRSLAEGDLPIARIILLRLKLKIIYFISALHACAVGIVLQFRLLSLLGALAC